MTDIYLTSKIILGGGYDVLLKVCNFGKSPQLVV